MNRTTGTHNSGCSRRIRCRTGPQNQASAGPSPPARPARRTRARVPTSCMNAFVHPTRCVHAPTRLLQRRPATAAGGIALATAFPGELHARAPVASAALAVHPPLDGDEPEVAGPARAELDMAGPSRSMASAPQSPGPAAARTGDLGARLATATGAAATPHGGRRKPYRVFLAKTGRCAPLLVKSTLRQPDVGSLLFAKLSEIRRTRRQRWPVRLS